MEKKEARKKAFLLVMCNNEDFISASKCIHSIYTNKEIVNIFTEIEDDDKRRDILSVYSPIYNLLYDKEFLEVKLVTNEKNRTIKEFKLNIDKFGEIFFEIINSIWEDWEVLKPVLRYFKESFFFKTIIMGLFKEYQRCFRVDGKYIEKKGDFFSRFASYPILSHYDKMLPFIELSPSTIVYFIENLYHVYNSNKHYFQQSNDITNQKEELISELRDRGKEKLVKELEGFIGFKGGIYTTSINVEDFIYYFRYDCTKKRFFDDDIITLRDSDHETTHFVYLDFNNTEKVIDDLNGNFERNDVCMQTFTTNVIWMDNKYKGEDKFGEALRIIDNIKFKKMIEPISIYLPNKTMARYTFPLDKIFKEWYNERKDEENAPDNFDIDLMMGKQSNYNGNWKKFLEKENNIRGLNTADEILEIVENLKKRESSDQ